MLNKKGDLDIAAKNIKITDLQPEPKFEKKQLLVSKKYFSRRDLMDALLEDKKLYTITEIENLVNKYRKGMVK